MNLRLRKTAYKLNLRLVFLLVLFQGTAAESMQLVFHLPDDMFHRFVLQL